MKKIFLIGIGGIAMANLACFLKKRGHIVSGSDLNTFGPSAILLKKYKINYFKNHNASNIKKYKPDITVIGNAIHRGNASLEYILNNRLPYYSMPEMIKSELLQKSSTKITNSKKSIVITGTSGKTTTTALLTWILYVAGLKPSALIGGIAKNFATGFVMGSGPYVIIEGDEYNSSFYDNSPKFVHYLPFIGVINNIRPDHLDIYGSIEEIIKAFRKLPRLIPENGLLVLNSTDKNSKRLKNDIRSKIETFGQRGSIMAKNIRTNSSGLTFELCRKNKRLGEIKSDLIGKHNVENILSASTVALHIGIPFKKIAKAAATFKGVERRLEVIYNKNEVTVIDDFAHNPDKVSASLSALKDHFPKHKIIAIFEPRTGSSRRKFFQDTYSNSFSHADTVYIAEPYKKNALNAKGTFSSQQLAKDLNKKGINAFALASADKIISTIAKHNSKFIIKNSPILIIVMTSGDFDGIHQKLITLFK